MNKSVTLAGAALLAALAAQPADAFKIDWTGGADGVSFFDEGNWDSALTQAPPAAGTVDPASPINLIIDLSGASQSVDASAGPLTIGATGLLQVTGVNLVTSDTIRRDNSPLANDQAPVAMIISNSPQSIASVSALGLSEIDVALINTLTLTDSADPLRFSTVGFSSSESAGATLILANESVADVVAEHLGKFTVGDANAPAVVGSDPAVAEPGDNLRIISDGASGSVISPILFDPADLDADGDVDDADFGITFAAFTGPNNGPSSNPAADLDNDGDVDDADFGIAFAAFTGPGGPASVPEPASLALLALGGLIASSRRR